MAHMRVEYQDVVGMNDISSVALNLSPENLAEYDLFYDPVIPVTTVISEAADTSLMNYVVYDSKERPRVMGGVSITGALWTVVTDSTQAEKVAYLRIARPIFSKLTECFLEHGLYTEGSLYCLSDARNTLADKWYRWLGLESVPFTCPDKKDARLYVKRVRHYSKED